MDDSSFPYYSIMMNIIIWDSRGALKPSFQSDVRELITKYDLAILVIMETHIGGDRAKEITDRLPFQGAIHTDMIGYVGGLWLLWNADQVEVSNLTSNEQEIHAIVKVNSSNLSWLFSAIYASPRFRERCLLWNNLSNVAHKLIIYCGLLVVTLMRCYLVMRSLVAGLLFPLEPYCSRNAWMIAIWLILDSKVPDLHGLTSMISLL